MNAHHFRMIEDAGLKTVMASSTPSAVWSSAGFHEILPVGLKVSSVETRTDSMANNKPHFTFLRKVG
jgi:hypothetical protein